MLLFLLACAPEEHTDSTLSHDIDGGRFVALLPASFPAPVLVFAHGWRSNPEKILRDSPEGLATFTDAGVMVLLPAATGDGEWNIGHSPNARDDQAFISDVLDEADARWGIDPARVWGTGFSVGGSIAHDMGCDNDRFTAISPMSGAFWEPLPADCGGAALPVRHVHGTGDRTWPLEGQVFSPNAAQGDIYEATALWRAQNGCTEATEEYTDGPLSCTRWECDAAPVELCLHDSGHHRRSGWADRMLGWLSAP